MSNIRICARWVHRVCTKLLPLLIAWLGAIVSHADGAELLLNLNIRQVAEHQYRFMIVNGRTEFLTRRLCQLTGGEDRATPEKLTGAQMSGVTGGVSGTDLGFSFEYQDKLYFFLGDSREWHPDVCEPQWCGTEVEPKPVANPPANPERVQRWHTNREWDRFVDANGDGLDSMATAPLDIDPEQCIPITFVTSAIGLIFDFAISGNTVADPVQLDRTNVASNPQDKWVVSMGNRLLVTTSDGRIFVHEINGSSVGVPFQLSGPNVGANPQDKWLLVMGNRLLVVTTDGRVFAHDVSGNNIGIPFQLSGPPVATHPQDKWLLVMGSRLLVVLSDGRVFAHEVTGNNIGLPFQLGGPSVAARPEDKWLVAMGGRLVVITSDGRVFAHDVIGNNVGTPIQIVGTRVAANPRDRRVLAMDNRLLVLTGHDGRFRPTRLDGQVLGRQEGAISGFADGPSIYAFFTQRDKPLGCTNPIGCAHDDAEPGGRCVLGQSLDGGTNFQQIKAVSTTKFLWAIPAVEQTVNVPGLPQGMGEKAVFIWGTGRKNNDRGVDVAAWNHSYPFLAVAPLSELAQKDGRVFAHDIIANTVGIPFQLTGPNVAASPQDKWLLVMGNRLLVVTTDGRVFAHDVSGNNIGVPLQLSGPPVAANPQDKWLLAAGNRLLVTTTDGRVFAHDITGNTVGVLFQLSGPAVAANPQDKWLLVLGGRLLVVTSDGRAFVHELGRNNIGVPFQLRGPNVGANSVDRWIVAAGNRLLVVTKQSWRYYAGMNGAGTPQWETEEAMARPLPPFGSEPAGAGYHECLGYFSVRFIEGWRKWVMLYTCASGEGAHPNNGRGVFLRTAEWPWGPWSEPHLIFDPKNGVGYCLFMHNQRADENKECSGSGLNPAEESVRDTRFKVTKRAWAGEYAPYLLPSRYAKIGPEQSTLYFLMSTWNPYQVMLMKTQITQRP